MADAATTETAGAESPHAFVEDSSNTSAFDLRAIMDKTPSPTAAAQMAGESLRSITDGAQGVITSYFPQKETAGTGEKKAAAAGGGEQGVPGLAASSSSDGSGTKEKAEDWAERLSSQCEMNTLCGKFEFEFMKKEERAPASRANALTEQGELPQIEGPPPPKPWTEQVSDATSEAASSVSKKAAGLMVSLGLAAKKDQALMTDYYKAKPKPSEPEKSLSEKAQEIQSGVSTKAHSIQASVMSTLGMGPAEKEMRQKLITDYDPKNSKPASQESSPDEIEQAASVLTEPGTEDGTAAKSAAAEVEKTSFWTKVKGLFGKLSGGKSAPAPECPKVEVPECPTVEVPECTPPEVEIRTPRIEIPSFTILSCIPNKVPSEEEGMAKGDEVKADETEPAEEVKVEETKEVSPMKSEVPW